MNLIVLHALLALTHSQAPGELLDWLPANTQTVVAVNDFRQAAGEYQSPEYQQSVNSFQERFAVTPDDVADLIVGHFLRAELVGTDGTVGEVAIAHAAADIDDAVTKLHTRLKRQNATVRVASFGSHTGSIVTRRRGDGTEQTSVHLIHAGCLLLADSVAAAKMVVKQVDTADGRGFAAQQSLTRVWNECSPTLNDRDLAITWYIDPWLKVQPHEQDAATAAGQDGERYEFAKRHGMNGIVGVGGSFVLGAEGEQTVQAFAYAPQPLASSIRMATHLQGTDDLTLPEWVSQAVTEIVVLHGNMGRALEHAGLLFDDGFADGVAGTYDEVLLDLHDLLELDIKKELYPQLGPRLYLISGAVKNRDWQPLVVAFEVKNAPHVAEILDILVADDPEAKEVVLAAETDRVWYVPGKRGGRDFVLGMLKGVAVYANDLEFARKALRFDESEPLLPAEAFVVARDRATQGNAAQPSILIVKNPTSAAQTSPVHPLDLVFQGPRFFVDREGHEAESIQSMQWLPQRLRMLLARHRLVVGFHEQDGWKFVARTAYQKREVQDDR